MGVHWGTLCVKEASVSYISNDCFSTTLTIETISKYTLGNWEEILRH